MSCESFQEDYLEFRAGRLPPERRRAISDHLRTCLDCQRAWADFQSLDAKLDAVPAPVPSERLSRNFYALLDTHLAAQREPGVFAPVRRGLARFLADWLPASPVARFATAGAACAAVLAAGLGWQAHRERTADLAALRQQMDAVTRLVAYTALEKQDAPERVRTVLAADASNDAGLARLLSALAMDPSVNVRLSALEELYPHVARPEVRAGVLHALTRETAPIVQVAMIDFLSAARSTEAQRQFERLSRDPAAHSVVRAAASRGLAQLL
jgi:hypothetical protein